MVSTELHMTSQFSETGFQNHLFNSVFVEHLLGKAPRVPERGIG